MRHRIYGALDNSRLRTAADKSRAKHLFGLMDQQEQAEQDYYNQSTAAYNKSKIFVLSSDIEDYIGDYISEINSDIKSTIKEYGLYGVGIWDYIEDEINSIYENWSRGDGLKYGTRYQDYKSTLEGYAGGDPAFGLGIYQGDNSGDPDDYYFGLDWIYANNILNASYDVYSKTYSYNEDEFYNFTIKIVDLLLQPITSAVNSGIEDCIDDNPPALE